LDLYCPNKQQGMGISHKKTKLLILLSPHYWNWHVLWLTGMIVANSMRYSVSKAKGYCITHEWCDRCEWYSYLCHSGKE
jgi:hypothetical protein